MKNNKRLFIRPVYENGKTGSWNSTTFRIEVDGEVNFENACKWAASMDAKWDGLDYETQLELYKNNKGPYEFKIEEGIPQYTNAERKDDNFLNSITRLGFNGVVPLNENESEEDQKVLDQFRFDKVESWNFHQKTKVGFLKEFKQMLKRFNIQFTDVKEGKMYEDKFIKVEYANYNESGINFYWIPKFNIKEVGKTWNLAKDFPGLFGELMSYGLKDHAKQQDNSIVV